MFWLRKPRRSATWRHGPGTGAWTTLPSAARPGAPPAPSRFRAGMARAATGGPPVPRPPCTLGSAWNCCGAPFSGAGAGAWGRGAAHTGPRRAGEPLTGPSGGRGAPHSGPRGQGSRSQVPSGAGELLTGALRGRGGPHSGPRGAGEPLTAALGAGELLTGVLRGRGATHKGPQRAGEPLTGALGGQGAAHRCPQRAGDPLTAALGGRGAPHSGPRGAGEPLTGALGGREPLTLPSEPRSKWNQVKAVECVEGPRGEDCAVRGLACPVDSATQVDSCSEEDASELSTRDPRQ